MFNTLCKSFFLIFLNCFFLNVHATNWVKYGSDANGDNFYVDTDSAKTTGNIIIFNGLRDLSQPEDKFGSLSSTGKFKVDCSEDKTMLMAYNFFSLNMGKGELITALPIPDQEWFYPVENTIGHKQIEFVCQLNRQV